MEVMAELHRLYSRYVADLRRSAEQLNSLYPEPSRISIRLMSREEFEQYLMETPASESKRLFVLRILDGNEELTARLPEPLKDLTSRRAA